MIKNPETLLIINVLKKDYEESSFIINSSTVDWNNIYKKTVDWGVLNKFYANICGSGVSELIPVNAREKFEKFHHFSTARNSLLIERFFNIHEMLKNEGIEIMPIKGLGLIFSVYSNISERFTSDIDIIVKEKDLIKTVNVLKKNGVMEGIGRNSPYWHTQLIDRNGIEIELHYKVPNVKNNSDIIEIFNNSKLMSENFSTCQNEINPFFLSSVNKIKFNIPSVEDLLIIQACSINLANALGQGSLIKTCLDYMVAIEKMGNNWSWDGFFERTERYGSQNYVSFVLLFLHYVFNWENKFNLQQILLQEKFMNSSILDTRLRRDDIFACFVRDGEISFNYQISSLYKFFTSGNFNDFIQHLKYALVPGKEKIAERYKVSPDSLKIFLYYPVKIFESVKRKLNFRAIFNTIKLARFLR